ncbi:stage II sporulation protein M [Lentisphaerota bacterium WC36G]|nr:stage II sporulation protein M [Lentisphaerae bacterium WC36]
MIIDLDKFVMKEKVYWRELEDLLKKINEAGKCKNFYEIQRLLYLYERASADFIKVANFSGNKELHEYLENLTMSAYAFIYSERKRKFSFRIMQWTFFDFPAVFRKNLRYFLIIVAVFLAGAIFAGIALGDNKYAKKAILPEQFYYHMQSPEKRVAREESEKRVLGMNEGSNFAAMLIQNNIKVSILAMALGITFGIGTIVIIFYNGVIFGLIVFDYLNAGQGLFLTAWLLPHGVVEIPAILIGGTAGLMIGHCLVKPKIARKNFFKRQSKDITFLIYGVVLLLIWAGIVEAFLSQHHKGVLSYEFKIMFGFFELMLFVLWLSWSRGIVNFIKKIFSVKRRTLDDYK